jgi:peroxiredoxin
MEDLEMRNAFIPLSILSVFALAATAQTPKTSKSSDEQQLRAIEAETGEFERQNDWTKMDLLADDWISPVATKVFSKKDFEENVKKNFASHGNAPSPYTIEKKNMQVYLFADTAVVTYIKEYRQTLDTAKFVSQDVTDVFTRSSKGWLWHFSKIAPLIPAPVQSSLKPPSEGSPAPDFNLKDASGKDVKLADLKGKVVLVNFWATWCEGCQVEIPWFIEFQKKYASRGLVVVGISMDDDGWKSVKPWIEEKKVNYPIVIGNDGLGTQYGLVGMPLTALVDREGKIVDVHQGIVDKTAIGQRIKNLLQ